MDLRSSTPAFNLKIKIRKETSKHAKKRNPVMEKITEEETVSSFSFIFHSQEDRSYI